jgi:predicted Holliday junction resolvase-like endonuclease
MSVLATFIQGGQRLIAQCPHCDELFQVLHARFIFPARDPGRCEYADLLALQANTSRLSGRLDRAQERFELEKDTIRAAATAQGQRTARRHVLRIDQVFSARKIDPQDVKVLFDPVDYVVFHGLNNGGVKEVRFISHEPETAQQERLVKAIAKVVQAGDVGFSTLRVTKEGGIDGERA